jgi:ABC-2 type transport system permease protein
MMFRRLTTSLVMILRMLLRRKIVLLLLVFIPAVFLSTVEFTTSERLIPFRLASLEGEIFIQVKEKEVSHLFLAVACTGFLISFLAMNLIQKNNETQRRLIICGYHPIELLVSNLLSLALMILLIAVYVGMLILYFFPIEHVWLLILGLVLIGFVYGSYGLAIGSLIKGELEGILLIVLLANIDAGWLQNPLFYAEAQNQVIIRYLPAYFPSQTAIIASFTDYSATSAIFNSVLYGLGFIAISMLIFFTKMRIKK